MNSKLHEFDCEISHFIELCEKLSVKTTIEIGAHEASLSKKAIQSQSITEVIALEANPFVFERYRHTLSPKIRFFNKAAMNYDGQVVFCIPTKRKPAETFNGSINKKSENKFKTQYLEILVDCITIDSLLPLPSPIALWIDAEGANREVLIGAEILLSSVALIMVEVEHRTIWQKQWKFKEVNKFLKEKGFILIDYNLQTINQTNCIYGKSKSTVPRVSKSKSKIRTFFLYSKLKYENVMLKLRHHLSCVIIDLSLQRLLNIYKITRNLVSKHLRRGGD